MTIASNTDSKLEGRENRALLWKERNNRIYHHLFSFYTLPSIAARYSTAH